MTDGFLLTLASLSLSGACVMALAELLCRLLGDRLSPEVRRLVWLLVLARLLCPWSLPGGMLDRAAEAGQAALACGAEAWEGPPGETSQHIQIPYPSLQDETGGRGGLETGLTLAWAAGCAAVLGRRGLGYARLCRGLRAARRPPEAGAAAVYARLTAEDRRPPALYRCAALPTPMLAGLLRPGIYLPELSLSQEELEGVLAHELTHWRRRDLWCKWLAALALAVHWFNPAAWALPERLDRDCELSCDQIAAQGWDPARRVRYGALLLRLAAGGAVPPAALFSQKQRLKERLILMKQNPQYGKKAAALGAAVCLTLALATTALGAYTGPAAVGEKLADLTQVSQPENTPKTLAWPLAAGEGAELSARFETRVHPITGETRSHTGVDLVQPEGTPVLAAADGAVVAVGFSQQYGNCVLLQHGDMTTRYAHLKEYTVQPGEAVSAGEAIGLVGRTGMATGAHLHFGVEVDGVPVDPMDYLPQA